MQLVHFIMTSNTHTSRIEFIHHWCGWWRLHSNNNDSKLKANYNLYTIPISRQTSSMVRSFTVNFGRKVWKNVNDWVWNFSVFSFTWVILRIDKYSFGVAANVAVIAVQFHQRNKRAKGGFLCSFENWHVEITHQGIIKSLTFSWNCTFAFEHCNHVYIYRISDY